MFLTIKNLERHVMMKDKGLVLDALRAFAVLVVPSALSVQELIRNKPVLS